MLNKFFNVFIILVFFISKNNAVHSQTEKKPNVLILFSDQHNKKTMGFENHPDVITPNLDQFSEESVVFDRAYATRGVCVPSRMSLMTWNICAIHFRGRLVLL